MYCPVGLGKQSGEQYYSLICEFAVLLYTMMQNYTFSSQACYVILSVCCILCKQSGRSLPGSMPSCRGIHVTSPMSMPLSVQRAGFWHARFSGLYIL